MTTTATRDELRRNHHYGPGAASRRHGLCIHAEPFGSCGFAAPTTRGVLDEVGLERDRQEVKWGEQNHPDGTGPALVLTGIGDRDGNAEAPTVEEWARNRTEELADAGACTYEAILTEEWAEAIAQGDPAKLRAELIQVAAVAVAWAEKIDRDEEVNRPEDES